jgi:hypothetical protein
VLILTTCPTMKSRPKGEWREVEQSLEGSVRCGLSGGVVWPVNIAIGFPMRFAATFLLFLVASCSSAPAPSENDIRVAVSSHHNNCTIREVPLPCSELGSKLKSMGVSPKQHIHLTGDSAVSYELMRSAMDSLDRAGYSTNVGFVAN